MNTAPTPSHTPGPWRVEKWLPDCWLVQAGKHYKLANVARAALQADARLIAAAPELLETLRALVLAAEASGQPLKEWAAKPFADARAAIAKATETA